MKTSQREPERRGDHRSAEVDSGRGTEARRELHPREPAVRQVRRTRRPMESEGSEDRSDLLLHETGPDSKSGMRRNARAERQDCVAHDASSRSTLPSTRSYSSSLSQWTAAS